MKEMFRIIKWQLWNKLNVSSLQLEERQFMNYISTRLSNESTNEPDNYDPEANKGKLQIILSLASHFCVETICHIGYDEGVSVLNWLVATSKARILAFDFSEESRDFYFGEEYISSSNYLSPDRYTLYQAPAISSISDYWKRNNTAKCNIISIGKYENTWMHLEAFRHLANTSFNVVMIENCCIGDVDCDLDVIDELANQLGTIILKNLFDNGFEAIFTDLFASTAPEDQAVIMLIPIVYTSIHLTILFSVSSTVLQKRYHWILQ